MHRAFQMMLQMKAHHLCLVLVLRFKEKTKQFSFYPCSSILMKSLQFDLNKNLLYAQDYICLEIGLLCKPH